MKRNQINFDAPTEMTEQVKKVAEDTYTSTSAVCRQAVAQYLTQRELPYNQEMTQF
jgi:predicted transcriptional regulator